MSVSYASLQEQVDLLNTDLASLKSHRVMCMVCGRWNKVSDLLTRGQNGRRCTHGDHASGYNYAP